jgi:hypothetical protein
MTDLSAFRAHWTEKRPAPLELTDTERLDWFGEHCEEYEYVGATKTTIGHHVIIDSLDQRTTAASFRDAIDTAAAKFKEINE